MRSNWVRIGTSLLPQALESLRVQQRVEIDGPADAKSLRHQDLRCILIPKSVAQPLKRWEAKVIGNSENTAMPRSLLGRTTQLIPDGCTYQDGEHYTSDHSPEPKGLLRLHIYFSFTVQCKDIFALFHLLNTNIPLCLLLIKRPDLGQRHMKMLLTWNVTRLMNDSLWAFLL